MKQNKRGLGATKIYGMRPRLKTQGFRHINSQKSSDNMPEQGLFPDIKRSKTLNHNLCNISSVQIKEAASESQSEKILNQFLLNYFKKKNKFVKRLKNNSKTVKPHDSIYLKSPKNHNSLHMPLLKDLRTKESESCLLSRNELDSYFDLSNIQ